MIKKAFLCLLCVVLCLSITACGDKKQTSQTSGDRFETTYEWTETPSESTEPFEVTEELTLTEIETETSTAKPAADREEISGQIEGIRWSFDKTDGTLTIFGNGDMPNIPENDLTNVVPWTHFINDIVHVDIQSGVKSIGAHCFMASNSLTSVSIANTVTRIGSGAFGGCGSLRSVSFREGSMLKTIGDHAFIDCGELVDFTIPKSVESIGEWSIKGCSSLTEIYIPKNVKEIGYKAFGSLRNVSDFVVDPLNRNYKSVNGLLLNKDGTVLICCSAGKTNCVIPSGVTRIEDGAVSGCEKLETIEIPDTVREIGGEGFIYCYELKTIYVPDNDVIVEGWGEYWNDSDAEVARLSEKSYPRSAAE